MSNVLKPRNNLSRTQDASSSPEPDGSLFARGTAPERDVHDAKPPSKITASRQLVVRCHSSACRRTDDENSDPRCTTTRDGAQSSSSLVPPQCMAPPTRKPQETHQHIQDSRSNSQQRPYPRLVPGNAGGARDLAPADTNSGDSVKIFVRVRPFNDNETLQGKHSCIQMRSDCQISLTPHSESSQYPVDKVFGGDTTQEDVFGVAGRGVVNSCLEGYNSCIFAYGQTGSGKTHTMLGALSSSSQLAVSSGLIPRIFDHLLSQMQQRTNAAAANGATEEGQVKHECLIGMLEVYNESITDLLCPESTHLQIRTKNRHIGETRMNRESSRSHCVLIATIRTERNTSSGVRNVRTSRLNLVDLAGSEQQKSSGASGERLKEASNINKSLSILGRVINSLAQQQRGRVTSAYIPYRDSKLTFLLQDSLGGNSKTVMIANISPSTHNITETQSTLRFAQRAKRMGNKAIVNEDTTGDAEQLRRELARVKRQIANCKCGASRTSGLKENMVDGFKDGEYKPQEQAIANGNLTVEDAALLVDENNRLKAQVEVLKASGNGVEESETNRSPTRDQLLEQVRNFQNLLLSKKAPGSIPSGAGTDGTLVDTLLVGMDIGSETAMAAGAEHMCLQKTKEAEITEEEATAVRADADELRAQVADLEEQVAEATTQLMLETEGKITAQDELGQVKECLEASMSSCQKLKEQNEEQQIELEELSSKASLLHETLEEMNIVNAKNKELMSRNVKLEWDATAAEELRQSQLLKLSTAGLKVDDLACKLHQIVQERDDLNHEVATMRAAVTQLTKQSEATNSMAEELHARTTHMQELKASIQELEGERDTLEEALRSERDKRDQQAMSLRQEATSATSPAAVQIAADDDKQQTVSKLGANNGRAGGASPPWPTDQAAAPPGMATHSASSTLESSSRLQGQQEDLEAGDDEAVGPSGDGVEEVQPGPRYGGDCWSNRITTAWDKATGTTVPLQSVVNCSLKEWKPLPMEVEEEILWDCTTGDVYMAVVYVCLLLVKLGMVVVVPEKKWGTGKFSSNLGKYERVVRRSDGEVRVLQGWYNGPEGFSCVLYLLLFVLEADAVWPPVLKAQLGELTRSSNLQQVVTRLESDEVRTCGALYMLLVKMVQHAPVIARAYALYKMPVPIDWIVPVASNRSKITGLIVVLHSLGLAWSGDNAAPLGKEMFLWDIVLAGMSLMPHVESVLENGARAKWGIIGHNRRAIAAHVAMTLHNSCGGCKWMAGVSSCPMEANHIKLRLLEGFGRIPIRKKK